MLYVGEIFSKFIISTRSCKGSKVIINVKGLKPLCLTPFLIFLGLSLRYTVTGELMIKYTILDRFLPFVLDTLSIGSLKRHTSVE